MLYIVFCFCEEYYEFYHSSINHIYNIKSKRAIYDRVLEYIEMSELAKTLKDIIAIPDFHIALTRKRLRDLSLALISLGLAGIK